MGFSVCSSAADQQVESELCEKISWRRLRSRKREKARSVSVLIHRSSTAARFLSNTFLVVLTWCRCGIILVSVKPSGAQWLLFHYWSVQYSQRNHSDGCVGRTCHMNKCVCVCFCTRACWPDGRQTQRSLSFTLIYHLFTNSITGWLTAP